jgi:post-segregation antitoxin (ccd killing protein)
MLERQAQYSSWLRHDAGMDRARDGHEPIADLYQLRDSIKAVRARRCNIDRAAGMAVNNHRHNSQAWQRGIAEHYAQSCTLQKRLSQFQQRFQQHHAQQQQAAAAVVAATSKLEQRQHEFAADTARRLPAWKAHARQQACPPVGQVFSCTHAVSWHAAKWACTCAAVAAGSLSRC